MVDEVFGRFRLDERIGHGGMGEVFRAFDTRKQCGVVLGPDQRSLYFTTIQGWFVFDLETDRVTQLIPHTFRSGWWHVAITPDGRRAYLNDTAAATLLVADLRAA